MQNPAQALLAQGRFDEALAAFEAELRTNPRDPGALFGRANAFKGLGRLQEARADFDAVLAQKPNAAGAFNNRGDTLLALKLPAAALADFERALVLQPGMAQAHLGKGIALQRLNRLEESLPCFDRALQIWPELADAYFFSALSREWLDRPDEAVRFYDRMLALEPNPAAMINRATVLLKLKRYSQAAAGFQQYEQIAPGNGQSLNGMAFAAAHSCDWSRWEEFRSRIAAALAAGDTAIQPASLMPYSNDPALMLAAAKNVTADLPRDQKPLWRGTPFSGEKIKLAYCSADFFAHPTLWVMAEIFERHDRERFELFAIDFGPGDHSDILARVKKSFDHFHSVAGRTALEIAELIAELGIDIAVDLKGLTERGRPAIFAHRPAPVTAAYLGYCGTVGVDFLDYVLVDRIVVPLAEQPFYAEKIVHLPDSYYPTDSTRAVPPAPTRAEAGLPERGFVFCCFNNNWKITPAIFALWMRLLKQVPDSVLWLIADNDEAAANLKRSAAAEGMEQRVILAPRAGHDAHFARHQLADLVLDTPVYGAHTTATDALWLGVPVVTCRGHGWTGRVGASLLTAIGLTELITDNLDDYERLALALATDPARLKGVKGKLWANRLTTPLFDCARLTRNMEAAYEKMRDAFLNAAK